MYASLVALGISPATVEFNLDADGSTDVAFRAWYFTGALKIGLEGLANIAVEPSIVPVVAQDNGYPFTLTLHGDPSLGSQIIEGKILFVGVVHGQPWTVGIKVGATIHHIVAGVQPEEERRDPLDTFIRTMEGIRPKCPVGAIETAWIELTEKVIEITPAVKILPREVR